MVVGKVRMGRRGSGRIGGEAVVGMLGMPELVVVPELQGEEWSQPAEYRLIV